MNGNQRVTNGTNINLENCKTRARKSKLKMSDDCGQEDADGRPFSHDDINQGSTLEGKEQEAFTVSVHSIQVWQVSQSYRHATPFSKTLRGYL